ncbi:MAG: hypothetical protein C4337_06095 [Armatimonadota bacterium]
MHPPRSRYTRLPIGIVVNLGPQQPATDNPQDYAVTLLWHQFLNGYFLDPIFVDEYPQGVLSFIGEFAPPPGHAAGSPGIEPWG